LEKGNPVFKISPLITVLWPVDVVSVFIPVGGGWQHSTATPRLKWRYVNGIVLGLVLSPLISMLFVDVPTWLLLISGYVVGSLTGFLTELISFVNEDWYSNILSWITSPLQAVIAGAILFISIYRALLFLFI
jgi:phosphate/sulfate permease